MTPTTLLAVGLALLLAAELHAIGRGFAAYRRDRRQIENDAVVAQHQAMLARTVREDVGPWPTRQRPTDLQAAYAWQSPTGPHTAVYDDEAPPWPWRSRSLEPGLSDLFPVYEMRGVYWPRSDAEILADLDLSEALRGKLGEPITQEAPGPITEEFRLIMESTWTHADIAALERWCSHCETRAHADCPGCACPCVLAVQEAAP